jgi:hypothetical protein
MLIELNSANFFWMKAMEVSFFVHLEKLAFIMGIDRLLGEGGM